LSKAVGAIQQVMKGFSFEASRNHPRSESIGGWRFDLRLNYTNAAILAGSTGKTAVELRKP